MYVEKSVLIFLEKNIEVGGCHQNGKLRKL